MLVEASFSRWQIMLPKNQRLKAPQPVETFLRAGLGEEFGQSVQSNHKRLE